MRSFKNISLVFENCCADGRKFLFLRFKLQKADERVAQVISDLKIQDQTKVEAFVGEFDSLSKEHDEILVDQFNNDDVYKKSLEEVLFLLESSNSCVESFFLAGSIVQKEHFI